MFYKNEYTPELRECCIAMLAILIDLFTELTAIFKDLTELHSV